MSAVERVLTAPGCGFAALWPLRETLKIGPNCNWFKAAVVSRDTDRHI